MRKKGLKKHSRGGFERIKIIFCEVVRDTAFSSYKRMI